MASALVALPAGTSVAAVVLCGGLPATIVGDDGPNVIDGTSGDDVIHGLGGGDVIKGKGGDDVICGGPGNDVIHGNAGEDLIIGGPGHDRLEGDLDADEIRGGGGRDQIWGGGGDDLLLGGAHADAIYAGPGADVLRGKKGGDTLVGGGHADDAEGGNGSDACDAEIESACELAPLDFSVARFYVTQGVPAADSDDDPSARVGTLEGRDGLVRVFLTASRVTAKKVPEVTLHWRTGSGAEGSVVLSRVGATPTAVAEGTMANSFNYVFDEAFLADGMEIHLEIDPGNDVAEGDETDNRWPASGWYDLGVVSVPSFDVTFVPMTVNGVPATVNQTIAENLLAETLAVMPVADYSIEIRSPVSYTGSNWGEMLDVVTQAKLDDGSPRIYVGIVDDDAVACCTGGIGWIGWGASVALEYPGVVAHELGHNLDLLHAPCGNPAGLDPDYPYANGLIGSWGYEHATEELKDPGNHRDLMSYCSTTWISDYNYDRALDFRTSGYGYSQSAAAGDVVMAFTGAIEGIDRHHIHVAGDAHEAHDFEAASVEQETHIARASAVAAQPLPPRPGPHHLVGVDASGSVVADISFAGFTLESAALDAATHFAFSVSLDADTVASVVEWQIRDTRGAVRASRAAA